MDNMLVRESSRTNNEIHERKKSGNCLVNREANDLIQILEFVDEKSADESDEETIATFITADGQQLALYAVEDSDEIFAVAVYDASGEPPTDFQFLMKSDVEKLIGEGAVKTVKKPSQLKQQIYKVDGVTGTIDNSIQSEKESIDEEDVISNVPTVPENNFCDENLTKNSAINEFHAEPIHSENWSNNMYFMVQNYSEDITKQQDELITDEMLEKSTVQCILCDDPRDHADLTFDDVEKVLAGHVESKCSLSNENLLDSNKKEKYSNTKAANNDKELDIINNSLGEKPGDTLIFSTNDLNLMDQFDSGVEHENGDNDINELAKEKTANIFKSKRPRKQQLTIVNRTDSEIIIQPASMMASFGNDDDYENHYENGWYDRRKKRGRRKKRKDTKTNKNIQSCGKKKRRLNTSSGNRSTTRKAYRIEVINIDVDDLDKEIITLEENGKEKGSSDKENDVIMVGDSDDEGSTEKEDEIEIDDDSDDSDYHDYTTRTKSTQRRSSRRINKSNIFLCQHCDKPFRQKRARDTHSRMCLKAQCNQTKRTATVRSNRSNQTPDSETVKKQYECKTCHERFEVVVALARHVRLVHSLKKKTINTIAPVEYVPMDQTNINKETNRLRGKKKSLSPTVNVKSTQVYSIQEKKGLNKKKLMDKIRSRRNYFSFKHMLRQLHNKIIQCNNCGKWCSSMTLLLNHSLRHLTKKKAAEKIINEKCRRCKTTFESRFMYTIHHLYFSNNDDISIRDNIKLQITKPARRRIRLCKDKEKLLTL